MTRGEVFMLAAPGSISCVDQKTKKTRPLAQGRYLYISGLVKAKEMQLLDQIQQSRLLDAASLAEIGRLLTESAYPAAKTPQEMLAKEAVNLLDWLQKDLPEPELAQVLLTFNDIHNLKLVLKVLLQVWLAHADGLDPAQNPQADAENKKSEKILASFSRLDELPAFTTVKQLAAQPAQVDAELLYQSLAENDLAGLPAWIQQAALAAIDRYMGRYDLGDLESSLDQLAWQRAYQLACQTGCSFLIEYLAKKADLINLEMLLRTRLLASGEAALARALLPLGHMPKEKLAGLYAAEPDQISQFYAKTPYAALARMAGTYDQPGQAAQFALLADNLLQEHIRSASLSSSGPEVPLAFVLARQLEIKNIRIVITCLENNVPQARMRELVRDSYLSWR